jgi:hypothetical protein
MHITHSFLGTTVGSFRYLFFALYEDYTDYGRSFVRELNDVYLQRLARDLRDHGAVIQPFLADIEATRSHVLSKDWTHRELEQIRLVPSLLVISKDFDDFSPRSDPWLILHFGERRYGGPGGFAELDEAIRAITVTTTDLDSEPDDLYKIACDLTREHPDVGQIFSTQVGMFGISIDVVKAGQYLWIPSRLGTARFACPASPAAGRCWSSSSPAAPGRPNCSASRSRTLAGPGNVSGSSRKAPAPATRFRPRLRRSST